MQSTTPKPISSITLRGSRKRQIATRLKSFHHPRRTSASVKTSATPPSGIRVVCISDTHNRRPATPHGDLLIHAGDLTEDGSFAEMQAELTWLSSQPHRYKVFVAGNHDVLLDDVFLEKHPERRYGDTRTKLELDWGDAIYLQDCSVMLEFPCENGNVKKLVVYGSPWTPQYGTSAFQHRPGEAEAHWEARFSKLETKPDVLVTHGPPRNHLDRRDFHRAGCAFLASEVARMRPKVVVFGHIHVGYGVGGGGAGRCAAGV